MEIKNRQKNAEISTLQASQLTDTVENLSPMPESVSPVEVEGCPVHRKQTRIE